ncbi:MAG TPA: hypothetical protein VFV50_01640 [Bdellovibrionales bacterium]|nr:hypothetical protein [Bdellovibrionales bacterium]
MRRMKFGNRLSFALALLLVMAPAADASFSRTWRRYPRPDEILVRLKSAFPLAEQKKLDPNCVGLTPANRGRLGDNSPSDGLPQSEAPEIVFLGWLSKCTTPLVESEFTESAAKEKRSLRRLVSGLFAQSAEDGTGLQKPWASLEASDKQKLLKLVFERVAGPDALFTGRAGTSSADDVRADILRSLEEMLSAQTTAARPFPLTEPTKATVGDAAKLIAYLAVMRVDVFFAY